MGQGNVLLFDAIYNGVNYKNLIMNVWINEYPIISEKANLISSFSKPNAKLYFEIYLFSDCTY